MKIRLHVYKKADMRRRYTRIKEERSGKLARRSESIRQSFLTSDIIEGCDYIWNRALRGTK